MQALAALGLLASAAFAQSDWDIKSSVQVGADAWHLSSAAADEPARRFLWMPNSASTWQYRDAAPWYTLQSQLRTGSQGEWVLRARGNQGYGSALDQLSYAHAISPTLGLRAGILDYRATWCREYDLDNPWVRETDPFCTVRFINLATASSPALQVYAKADVGDYQVQGVAGLYRPAALGFEPREFSNLLLPESATVTKNHKHALSVNAINTQTATQWRISWIGANQRLFDSALMQFNDPAFYARSQLNYEQAVSTYFVGVSWQLLPGLRSRLTHLNSQLRAQCEFLNPAAGDPESCGNRFYKSSIVWELGYQLSAADVLSLAASQYQSRQAGTSEQPKYEARNRSVSLAWRRDWPQGFFSAVQLTHARASVPYNRIPTDVPYIVGTTSAWGLGLRVGCQF